MAVQKAELNWGPLSDITFHGKPNWAIRFRVKAWAKDSKGITSGMWMVHSMQVSKWMKPPNGEEGPTKSMCMAEGLTGNGNLLNGGALVLLDFIVLAKQACAIISSASSPSSSGMNQ